MIDGKVATALSDVTDSTLCCSVCGCKPVEMNNIDKVISRPVTSNGLKYGLSTLHAWIRCMECCLKIAYKLPVKKWQSRCNEEKAAISEKKSFVQNQLRDKLGLVVDIPKSSKYTII